MDLLREPRRRRGRDPARDQAAAGQGRREDGHARLRRPRADVDRPRGSDVRPGRGRHLWLVQQRPRLGADPGRGGPGDRVRLPRVAGQEPAARPAPLSQLALLGRVDRDVRAGRCGVRGDDPDAAVLAGAARLQRDPDGPADGAAGLGHGGRDAAGCEADRPLRRWPGRARRRGRDRRDDGPVRSDRRPHEHRLALRSRWSSVVRAWAPASCRR